MLYSFVCGGCGYEAEVSGGEDCGMVSETLTIECKDCRELYDIVTSYSEWNRDGAEERKSKQQRCPSNARHRIKPWNEGGTCPRCGESMQKGELRMLWD